MTSDALRRPVVGYGDNYDMLRLMDVYGIWPAEGIRGIGHPQAPWRRYVFADFGGSCAMYSSQVVLHAPSIAAMKLIDWVHPGSIFDIRTVGFSQALLVIILAAVYSWRFFRLGHRGAALLNALTLAVLVGDPINTLFLNGFYSEFSAVFFLYWAMLEALVIVMAGCTPRRVCILALALFMLSTSKQQHWPTAILLGVGIVVADWLSTRRFRYQLALAVCLATGAGTVVWGHIMAAPENVNLVRCNMTDSILAGILPLAKDRSRAVALLGLPPRCVEYIGMSWYDPRVYDGHHPCPEVFGVSRLRLLRLFWDDPALAWRMFSQCLDDLEQQRRGLLVADHLGQVEGGYFAQTPAWTISTPVTQVKGTARRVLWLLPLGLVACYTIRAILRLRKGRLLGVEFPVVLCGVLGYTLLFLVVVGDGYQDYMRHCHLSVNLLVAVYVLAGAHLGAWVVMNAWQIANSGWHQPNVSPISAAPEPMQAGRPRVWCLAVLATVAFIATTALTAVWLRAPFPIAERRLPAAPQDGDGCGQFEMASRKPHATEVSGWIFGVRNNCRLERVILAQAGRVLPVHVFHGWVRQELIRPLGSPSSPPLGWLAAIPERCIDLQIPLQAFALLQDGTIVRLPSGAGARLTGSD